jgi:redox-sensitive bicupin YhaK (pirin superfamily)
VAAPDGRDGALRVQQNARLYVADLKDAATVDYRPEAGRRVYLHVARGVLQVNGVALNAGDGARIEAETVLAIKAAPQGEVLLFDLP